MSDNFVSQLHIEIPDLRLSRKCRVMRPIHNCYKVTGLWILNFALADKLHYAAWRVSTGDVYTVQAGSVQVLPVQVGYVHVFPVQVGFVHGFIVQLGPLQLGFVQVFPVQVGSVKVGSVQVFPVQVGYAQIFPV